MFDPLQIPHVWRARSLASDALLEPTGFAALDAALGGGWPKPALIEVLTELSGIGELQLITPLLRSLQMQARTPLIIAWFNPPHEPNATALAQHDLLASPHWLIRTPSRPNVLWSMEQSLKCGACAAVLAWLPSITMPSLRRLKLAVASGQTYGVLYRPTSAAAEPSPAQVRLLLRPHERGLSVQILKARSREISQLTLNVDSHRLRARVRS